MAFQWSKVARRVRRRQRKLYGESLEPRVCLSGFAFRVLAHTGESLSRISDFVSLNDVGQVSYVGHNQDGHEGVYVSTTSGTKLVSFANGDGRRYGRAAAINDHTTVQVAARDLTSVSNHSFLRRWPADGTTSERVDVAVSKHVFLPEPEDFDSILSLVDINDHNRVVFIGPDSGSGNNIHKLRVRSALADAVGGASIEIGDFPSTAGLRPQISNSTEVVFRSPSGQSIFKTDPMGAKFRRIAGTPEGFSEVGRSPGITDDGRAIAFYGNHPNENQKGDGLGGGPGIFVSLLKPGADAKGGAASRMLVRLAGRPGELGRDENGGLLKLLDFATFAASSGTHTTDARVGVAGALSHKKGSASLLFATFLANDPTAGDRETLWRVPFTVSVDENNQMTVDVDRPQRVLAVGDEVSKGGTTLGRAADLELYDPINNKGEIAFWARLDNGSEAAVLSFKPRNPVLLVPGIVGTFAGQGGEVSEESYLQWLMNRGVAPSNLQIDPLGGVYNDIIQTLKNAGYVEGKDLFIANYDWRVLPGPIDPNNLGSSSSDWKFDGKIEGLGSHVQTQKFDYGVDYLMYWMKQAADAWNFWHPGQKLENVDIIAHSTGGLVTRSYIQSDVYNAPYQASFGATRLPKVDKFVMVGVPNRGASKAWNFLQDNFKNDPVFRFVLSRTIKAAFEKQKTVAITGPDGPIQGETDPVTFINRYIPTVRTLLATYDFLYYSGADFPTNVNHLPADRNNLGLDLNAGHDTSSGADPNRFADDVGKVINVFGTNAPDTPHRVREQIGPAGSSDTLVSFLDVLGRSPQADETWYQEIECAIRVACGDGTVPLDSSLAQFEGDPRIKLLPFSQGGNTQGDVGHTKLLSNADVQAAILRELRQPVERKNIATGQAKPGLNNILTVIFDPVEGFLIDGQGRRLGYSAATGVLEEIPGSIYVGGQDGIGWIFGPVVAPLTFELTGVGAEHFAEVSGSMGVTEFGVESRGILAAGEKRNLTVVTSINYAPEPTDDWVEANAARVIDVLANDRDLNGDTLQLVSLDTTATVGTAVIAPAGKITYTPRPGFDGIDTLRYTVSDGKGATASAEVRVAVPGRPRIIAIAPEDLSETPGLSTITIDFSHPMDQAAVTDTKHYQVAHDTLGNLALASAAYSEAGGAYRVTLTPATPHIAPGRVRVQVDGQSLRTATGQSINGTRDAALVVTPTHNTISKLKLNQDDRYEVSSPSQLIGFDIPRSIAAGDINGDGLDDVIAASLSTGEIVIHINRSNGLFEAPTSFELPRVFPEYNAMPEQPYLADWDGDGTLDLLIYDSFYFEGQFDARRIHIYLNDGRGDFRPAPNTPIFVDRESNGTILGVGDFTGDGLNDLAISGPPVDGVAWNRSAKGSVSIYAKDPFLGYSERQRISTNEREWFPDAGVTGDFNGDGRLDLIVSTNGFFIFSPGTVMFLSTPTGLGPAQTIEYDRVSSGRLAADDFTGDGKLDLAIVHSYYSNGAGVFDGDVLTVMVGDGQGGFTEMPHQVLGRRGTALFGAADLNRDGKKDLALSATPWPANLPGGFPALDHLSTWSLLGDGRGNFTPLTVDPVPVTPLNTGGTWHAVLADLNGDGFRDAVVGNDSVGVVRSSINDRTGKLQGNSNPQWTGTLLNNYFEPQYRVQADVNQDGRSDLVALVSDHIVVYLATNDGRYEQFSAQHLGTFANWLIADDFNNDGRLDLVVGVGGKSVMVMLGDGNGRFSTSVPAEADTDIFTFPGTVGDVNGDGNLDLLVSISNGWALFFGDGRGGLTYSRATFVAYVEHPGATPSFADFNRDGKLDFVISTLTADGSKSQITLYRGNGNGTFTPSHVSTLPVVLHFQEYQVYDLNGDGHLDVVARPYRGTPELLAGDGTGRFQLVAGAFQALDEFRALGNHPWYYWILNTAFGDLNGDGALDVVATKTTNATVALNEHLEVVGVMLNDRSGRMLPAEVLPIQGYHGSLQIIKETRWVDAGAFSIVSTLWPVKLTSPTSIRQNEREIRGLGPANTVVRVLENNVELARGNIDAQNAWKITLPANLSLGRHVMELVATDSQGQMSAPTQVTLEILPPVKAWQNPRNPLDVSDDNKVTTFDLTLILRELGIKGSYRLPTPNASFRPPPYYDTFADDLLTVTDATQLLRFLGQGGAGGEAAPPASTNAATAGDDSTPPFALDPNLVDAALDDLLPGDRLRRRARSWQRFLDEVGVARH